MFLKSSKNCWPSIWSENGPQAPKLLQNRTDHFRGDSIYRREIIVENRGFPEFGQFLGNLGFFWKIKCDIFVHIPIMMTFDWCKLENDLLKECPKYGDFVRLSEVVASL